MVLKYVGVDLGIHCTGLCIGLIALAFVTLGGTHTSEPDDIVAITHDDKTCRPLVEDFNSICGYPTFTFLTCPHMSTAVCLGVATMACLIIAAMCDKPTLLRGRYRTFSVVAIVLHIILCIIAVFTIDGVVPTSTPLMWSCTNSTNLEAIDGWETMLTPAQAYAMNEKCGECVPHNNFPITVAMFCAFECAVFILFPFTCGTIVALSGNIK